MSTSHSVQVSNIASATTREHLYDFFAFCGKITDVAITEGSSEKSQTAIVSFEKPTAAKTALMLNGGTLDGSNITVTSETDHVDEPSTGDHPIDQTDKPRAGIAAEYLAKGYVLSDQILQRAIDLDQKQGISTRFLNYLKHFDTTVGQKVFKPESEGGPHPTVSGKVTSTVKSLDEQRGISKTATDYYSKAIQSPFGQRVYSFYSSTSKQVLDIHEEARRIADIHKTSTPGPVVTEQVDAQPITTSSGVEK